MASTSVDVVRCGAMWCYVLTRRWGADTAHTQMGRPTYEAPTREYTVMWCYVVWRLCGEVVWRWCVW
jgi:hypothetical protein